MAKINLNDCKDIKYDHNGNRKLWKNDIERFYKSIELIHPNKYDYSNVKSEHIQTIKSRIPLVCNNCKKSYNPTILSLIIRGKGCSCYSNSLPWKNDIERLVKLIDEKHKNKYNCSNVRKEDIQNTKSRIPLICRGCNKLYNPTISDLVHGYGCPCYSNNVPWKYDLERFNQKFKEICYDKYDASNVKKEDILNSSSRIPLICKGCKNPYNPTISELFNTLCNCPCYSNKVPWKHDLERFNRKFKEICYDKYDALNVKKENIIDVNSRVPLICKGCKNPYNPTINELFNVKTNCRCYCDHVLWYNDLDRFLKEANNIHGDRYDYSQIKSEHIINNDSKLPLICKKCKNIYMPTIFNFLINKTGCRCYVTNYSRKSIAWLNYKSKIDNTYIQHIENDREYTIPGTRYHVDGYSKDKNKIYEFLGDFWHGNPNVYQSDKINPRSNKTFGQLYDETLARLEKISQLGYQIEIIWEQDWDKISNIIK